MMVVMMTMIYDHDSWNIILKRSYRHSKHLKSYKVIISSILVLWISVSIAYHDNCNEFIDLMSFLLFFPQSSQNVAQACCQQGVKQLYPRVLKGSWEIPWWGL